MSALVKLKDGRVYVGRVEVGEHHVRLDGWRRVRHGDHVLLDTLTSRCWPWAAIAEVRLDDRVVAA